MAICVIHSVEAKFESAWGMLAVTDPTDNGTTVSYLSGNPPVSTAG